MSEEKLSKKQQKALLFKKSKDERSQEKQEKRLKKELEKWLKRTLDEALAGTVSATTGSNTRETSVKQATPEHTSTAETAETAEGEPEKKKRKTRRGKKGKGVNGGKGPRFILFVGNLPYDTQQAELDTHFKNASPDRIRIRREKGIAFLEFDNDNHAIRSKMDHALAMHHLILRNRKINVELTAGGGGNSEARQQKLKEKNDKLTEERKEKMKKELAKRSLKGGKGEKGEKDSSDNNDEPAAAGGMHPARAALLKQ